MKDKDDTFENGFFEGIIVIGILAYFLWVGTVITFREIKDDDVCQPDEVRAEIIYHYDNNDTYKRCISFEEYEELDSVDRIKHER